VSRSGDVVTLALVASVAAVAIASARHRKTPWDSSFAEQGRRFNIPPDLLRAIAQHESGMNPTVVSKPNTNGSIDYGLMQVNSVTAAHYKVSVADLLDPMNNIRVAAQYMSDLRTELRDQFNDWTWIAAYNAGAPAIRAHGIFNMAYVSAVLYHWQMFQLGGVV